LCDVLSTGLVDPRSDSGHHSITQAGHCLDVGGLLRVVAEQTAERCYGLVDGVQRDGDPSPDLIEQVIDADDLTWVLGEVEQQSHRAHLDPGGLSIS
jgi:hypothetical protein